MARKKRAGEVLNSLGEVSQTIDLREYLNGNTPTEEQKALFAELAIEQINTRTLDGKTINGGNFKKYSKAYADKKGVTRDSVDLFLEGDMLDSITRNRSQEDENSLFIEIGEGETQKAFNHNTGDTLPKREFFGITAQEADRIGRSIINRSGERRAANASEEGFTLSELAQALQTLGLVQEE